MTLLSIPVTQLAQRLAVRDFQGFHFPEEFVNWENQLNLNALVSSITKIIHEWLCAFFEPPTLMLKLRLCFFLGSLLSI